MNDFYCPYCEHGMNREDINSQVHEDDHIGEWGVECPSCTKVFKLQAEASIDYWVQVKEEKEEG